MPSPKSQPTFKLYSAMDLDGILAHAASSPVNGPNANFRVLGPMGADLKTRETSDPLGVTLAVEQYDDRFLRLEVKDQCSVRFSGSHDSPLLFAEIVLPDRMEIAVIPTIGSATNEWRPHIVIDLETSLSRTAASVLIEDPQWTGLLGFLGSRNMEVGVRLLDGGMNDAAQNALWGKFTNPLAAAAGALIIVSAANPQTDKKWDPWLRNLAKKFPRLPDGAVILARRLLTRARSSEELDEARTWFAEGLRRGVPCYSLSVDWLARGLESLPGDDFELREMQTQARRLANRVDSGLAFTVARADI